MANGFWRIRSDGGSVGRWKVGILLAFNSVKGNGSLGGNSRYTISDGKNVSFPGF